MVFHEVTLRVMAALEVWLLQGTTTLAVGDNGNKDVLTPEMEYDKVSSVCEPL